MNYGELLSRAVGILRKHTFLILLGVLVALTSGGSSPSSGNGNRYDFDRSDLPWNEEFEGWEDWEWDWEGDIDSDEIPGWLVGVPVALLVGLILLVLIPIGLILWAISTVARGGLIAGVNAAETGEATSFSIAWGAAWSKLWRLLGIGFLPSLPGLALAAAGVVALLSTIGLGGVTSGRVLGLTLGPVLLVACLAAPVALVLTVLRSFANRACMLEDLSVLDSYKRGWQVLTANLGEAIVLLLVQIVVSIILGVGVFLVGAVACLCCLLWPLVLLANGAVTAYMSTLWTLAWREWTGMAPAPVLVEASAEELPR